MYEGAESSWVEEETEYLNRRKVWESVRKVWPGSEAKCNKYWRNSEEKNTTQEKQETLKHNFEMFLYTRRQEKVVRSLTEKISIVKVMIKVLKIRNEAKQRWGIWEGRTVKEHEDEKLQRTVEISEKLRFGVETWTEGQSAK